MEMFAPVDGDAIGDVDDMGDSKGETIDVSTASGGEAFLGLKDESELLDDFSFSGRGSEGAIVGEFKKEAGKSSISGGRVGDVAQA
jgi:hypothetical protein